MAAPPPLKMFNDRLAPAAVAALAGVPALLARFTVPCPICSDAPTPCDWTPLIVNVPADLLETVLPAAIDKPPSSRSVSAALFTLMFVSSVNVTGALITCVPLLTEIEAPPPVTLSVPPAPGAIV